MSKGSILALLILATLAGCSHFSPPQEPKSGLVRGGNDSVSGVSASDPEMLAAQEHAKSTLGQFEKRLAHPDLHEVFAVKTGLPTSKGNREHVWISHLRLKDGIYSGDLDNSPIDLPNLKIGDTVQVKRADVEDWVIFKSGKMEGGFTTELLMRREGQAPAK